MGLLASGLALALFASASRAMNWEGHDDWLESQSHGSKLRDHLPKPLMREYSSCEEIRARLKGNPYEQRPLPGKNCFDSDIVGDEGEPDLAPEK